jgi:DNA-binding CsgD family transcriptional regulator
MELKLRHLIGLSYEAALEPARWPELLTQVVQVTNSRSGFLRHVDLQVSHVGFFESIGYDPSWSAAYRNHYVNMDPYAATLSRLPVGVLRSSESVVSLASRRNTEYHNDYERPQDIKEGFACILAKNNGYDLQFSLQRGFRAAGFLEDGASMDLLNSLMPHLARAVQIQRHLSQATEQQMGAMEALHQLRVGVILTDRRGRPFFVNRAAEHMVATCSGVSIGREGLHLIRPDDAAQLNRLIADAARILDGEIAIAHDCLRVSALSGESLQIQVVPLLNEQTRWSASTPSGTLAIFLTKSGRKHLPVLKLIQLFGLTRVEARLAARLANGQSVEEIANEFSVSLNTARTHLKSIFNKTGVRRQSELVALLLTSVLAYLANDETGEK